MSEMSHFKKYLDLADQLIAFASKDNLAECARVLAINIAHYESKFGQLPLDETLEMSYEDEPNEAQLDILTKGMETLVGMLGGIVQGFNEQEFH